MTRQAYFDLGRHTRRVSTGSAEAQRWFDLGLNWCHALEMSNEPERAMASADTLATLCPDAGHINHMPAHIYALCGEYEKARIASEKAVRADDAYADYAGSPINFYVTTRCHDIHLLMFACMFLGQYRRALAAAEKMQRIITRNILTVQDRPKLATMTEGYFNMKMHVLGSDDGGRSSTRRCRTIRSCSWCRRRCIAMPAMPGAWRTPL
jgi:tetratricopeptide (TPR) repeat protein